MTMMLTAICLPVLGGAGLLLCKEPARKTREIFLFLLSLMTSLLVFGAMEQGGQVELLSIHPALTLAFRLDELSGAFLRILAVLWPIALLYSFEYMSHEHNEKWFFAFFTMTYGVVLAIAAAANLFTLYLFYELLTLVTLPLVMHEMDGKARFAGRRYILFSMTGAALAFSGMVILAGYGSLDFAVAGGTSLDLSLTGGREALLRWAFLLCFFGFGVKAAVWPGHMWLPAASVAPTPVSALLHAVAVVNSGVFAILRVTYCNFGPELLRNSFAQWLMMAACTFTILFGSCMSWRMDYLKRRLAYSTVSNLSYILLAASAMSGAGLSGALMHMTAHSVFKIILFFAAGAILCQSGREYISRMAGLGRQMPLTFAAFLVASLGLIGIPPLAGFESKWAVAQALVGVDHPAAAAGLAALVLSAFLTGLYQIMVLVPAFFPTVEQQELAKENRAFSDPGWKMKTSFVLLTLLALLLGRWLS